jgi:riboflavin kinase/FMN adenylyltransferase
VEGIVKKGRQIGKTIGFPTCNIEMQNYVISKLGVYAVKVNLLPDQKIYKGIANLGIRPTFNQKKILLEVNIFNFNKKIYGKRIRVEFVKFIRGEKKFENINNLKKQIKLDIKKAKKIN